jgi:hypothetical protein
MPMVDVTHHCYNTAPLQSRGLCSSNGDATIAFRQMVASRDGTPWPRSSRLAPRHTAIAIAGAVSLLPSCGPQPRPVVSAARLPAVDCAMSLEICPFSVPARPPSRPFHLALLSLFALLHPREKHISLHFNHFRTLFKTRGVEGLPLSQSSVSVCLKALFPPLCRTRSSPDIPPPQVRSSHAPR